MTTHEKRARTLNNASSRFGLERIVRFLRVFLFVLCTIGLLTVSTIPVNADESHRVIQPEITLPLAHWQFLRWQDGATVCDLFVRHEDWPTSQDVVQYCGQKVLDDWRKTPQCSGVAGADCSGLMLRLVSRSTETITEKLILPDITMRVEAINCIPGQVCTDRPELRVVAEEPVDVYQITRVHVRIGDTEKIYAGAEGQFKLPLTAANGGWLTYWADSSRGAASQLFQVKFRSVKLDNSDTPAFQLDLLTSEWAENLPAGSAMWEIFPAAGNPLPKIYEQPLAKEYLATANQYSYLAAHLIRKGFADARSCKGGGVLPDGSATACGEKAAAAQVVAWQNKYDEQIYLAATKYNVPARLLKGMLAQESQFWPVSDNPYEQGLGYVTEDGVSMLLLWNYQYYLSTCVPAFDSTICWGGYSNLREDRQTILRGIVFGKIGTSEEVDLLAAMLYASAAQTEQLVINVTRQDLSDVTTYEDMWKMSVANYYAGSGCLGETLRSAAADEPPLTWDGLATHLSGICKIADNYVARVLNYSGSLAISYPPVYTGVRAPRFDKLKMASHR